LEKSFLIAGRSFIAADLPSNLRCLRTRCVCVLLSFRSLPTVACHRICIAEKQFIPFLGRQIQSLPQFGFISTACLIKYVMRRFEGDTLFADGDDM
jgi:hypothetical protein